MLTPHESAAGRSRVDVVALKLSHPITDVVARYGVELHPAGRALVGRCPLHDDQGRPNLHVYADTESWYCYRCRRGGDCIRFIEEVERIGFLEAVAWLSGQHRRSGHAGQPGAPPLWLCRHAPAPADTGTRRKKRAAGSTASPLPGPEEHTCLAAAVELYANRLLSDSTALAYALGRGLDRATVERYRVGYAAGDELTEYLRWRHLPAAAARSVGLLTRSGREFLAGRIVVPALHAGEPIWAVGRLLEDTKAAGGDDRPKYLGLPGRKPLLGHDEVRDHDTVCVVEGVFDWLVLCAWRVPAVALVGTHASEEMRADLGRFRRLYLVLDSDDAGRTAAADLAQALGPRAVPVTLPALPGVKDVADLAALPDGHTIFSRAIAEAAQAAGGAGEDAHPAPPQRSASLRLAA